MLRKYTPIENYYKTTNNNYIMSFKKFNIEKLDDLYKIKKKTIMRFKRKRYRGRSKRGRGIPYVYQNRVYLGKNQNK